MIKAELKSEGTFRFIIDASIFNEGVLTKALYWYADSFIIYGVRMTITYMKLFWNLSQMQTKCIRMNM